MPPGRSIIARRTGRHTQQVSLCGAPARSPAPSHDPMLLGSGLWEGRFRRLSMDGIVVRLGWFASMDPALLVAITDRGDQIDLLVVAAPTPPAAAEQAMAAAADPNNLKRAQ